VLKYSILSLFTKFHPLVFQLRQKENFPVLECENGFWELRLGMLGAISSWLPLLAFTKFVELRFTVLISLDVLIDIKFCFKCRKETLWFHLEHLLYEILTLDIDFSNTFSKFSVVEIWSVYFYPEETITEFSNSFSLTKYYP
jgi:hypothetical protein